MLSWTIYPHYSKIYTWLPGKRLLQNVNFVSVTGASSVMQNHNIDRKHKVLKVIGECRFIAVYTSCGFDDFIFVCSVKLHRCFYCMYTVLLLFWILIAEMNAMATAISLSLTYVHTSCKVLNLLGSRPMTHCVSSLPTGLCFNRG